MGAGKVENTGSLADLFSPAVAFLMLFIALMAVVAWWDGGN